MAMATDFRLAGRLDRLCPPWPPWPPCPLLAVLEEFLENSSNGDPGGSCGMAPLRMSTDCLVETLTTASMTCSAASAIPSGSRAAAEW